MPITIDDLSRKLGLSPSTVSKALNGYSDVAVTTRDRVLQAATEMGYQPSATARNLRKQRTDRIGLVINYPIHIVNDFLAELLPSMAAVAERAKYNIVLYTSIGGQPKEITRLCQAREVDGMVILWPPSLSQILKITQAMTVSEMPHVMLPRRVPHPDVSYVAADHITGAKMLTQHLIEQGHRRIAFLSRPELFETDIDRRAGYRRALAEADIDADPALIVETGAVRRGQIEAAFLKLMADTNPPTAILCFTDPMAIHMLAIVKKHGMRVPEDIAIAGYDGILVSGLTTPTLTTIRQPLLGMGELAINTLLAHIADDNHPVAQHILPVNLVVRGSTGPNLNQPH